ncbi:hypothetical protein [Breznakiella homolactica]|uniref:Uncharacterized protein n=1 Tax=Breznakiella homolactica TaxID=2798577 RepID=A0A7T8B997_9SPIR|nr:hypothetical protein [Breznakiella homolactica]QQO08237.1 hypothetical protein JFL75_15035 [Breznakiella homolactica]
MAIQPIDLQALFSQLDKVGKTQAEQKEGTQIQQALQGAQIQKKTEERIKSVNETQDTGDGTERIKDRDPKKNADEESEEKKKDPESSGPEESRLQVVRDPDLGKNIDVSG